MKRSFWARPQGLCALGCAVFLLAACLDVPPREPPDTGGPPGDGVDGGFEDLGNRFFHDQDGRLVAVRDASGASTRFVYAGDGSHEETQHLSASDLALFEFLPHTGPPGTEVVLEGSGFGPTPGDNTVRFNGLPATVREASAWRLVVTVPEGATSGPLSLEVQGRAVSGATDFKVADAASLPVITGFHPSWGPVGSRVTLSGTGFAPELTGNQVFIGGQPARVESATPTQLVVQVSERGAPGRVRVSTAQGEVSSANDFVVISSGPVLGEKDVRRRLEVDGPAVDVSLEHEFHRAVLSFTLLRGESVSLAVANWESGAADILIYEPTGALVKTVIIHANEAQRVFLLPLAPRTGRYTVVLSPSKYPEVTRRGGLFALRRDLSGSLEKDASPVRFTGRPGQGGRYSFSGLKGEWLGLGVSHFVSKYYRLPLQFDIYLPSGGLFLTCGRAECLLPSLPEDGTYTVRIAPETVPAPPMELLLSRPVEQPLEVNGPIVYFSSERLGQPARYVFKAEAGEVLTRVQHWSTWESDVQVLYGPDDQRVPVDPLSKYLIDVYDYLAPQTGVYSLFLMPRPGSAPVPVQMVREATGRLDMDGEAVTLKLLKGQNARLTFSGNQGERVGLGSMLVHGLFMPGTPPVPPEPPDIRLHITGPDGRFFTSCGTEGCYLSLPLTGTYTVFVESPKRVARSVQLQLTRPLQGRLEVDGPAVFFNNTHRMMQAAHYTFKADANTPMTLALSDNNFQVYTDVRVLRPDGTLLAETGIVRYERGKVMTFMAATEGTYSIIVEPRGGPGHVSLRLIPSLQGASSGIDGDVTTVNLAVGQSGNYTFEGTAGDRLELGVASVHTVPDYGAVNLRVFLPDRNLLKDCQGGYGSPNSCELPILPVTGTYTVILTPWNGLMTMSVGVLLSRLREGQLTVDGPAVTFNASQVTHSGRYTFTAEAGTTLSLVLSDVSFTHETRVFLTKPDGYYLTGLTLASKDELLTFTAPFTGTYTLHIEPLYASTGHLTFRVSH